MNPKPDIKGDITRIKKLVRFAMALGTILAVCCHVLPPHYRTVCNAVAALCTGEAP